VCICYPSYAGSINRRTIVQASLVIKARPISKITNTKRTCGEAQMVQCPPRKSKALSSNPSTAPPSTHTHKRIEKKGKGKKKKTYWNMVVT
jgi:hypothetical protein